jgi:hypothetical protein
MSVYCGHCARYGHNAPHCPRTKERAADYMRKKEAGEETSYRERWAFRYRERIDEAQANRSRNRVCAYCKGSGHNRATCPRRLGHVQQHIAADKVYRAYVFEFLQREGLGVGALLNVSHCYYDKANVWREYNGPAIVQGINWDRFTLGAALNLSERAPAALRLNIPPVGVDTRSIPDLHVDKFIKGFSKKIDGRVYHFDDFFGRRPHIGCDTSSRLLSPSTAVVPPSGWLEASDVHPKKFAKSKDESETLYSYATRWRGNGYELFLKSQNGQ